MYDGILFFVNVRIYGLSVEIFIVFFNCDFFICNDRYGLWVFYYSINFIFFILLLWF